jgi:hypothetical protein
MFLLLAILLLPVQALAIPLSYEFSGTFGTGGTVSGFLTYESSAAPITTDVRGLLGNQVYAPTAWGFTIEPLKSSLPSTLIGNSLEFCAGKCLFGVLESTTLRVGTSAGIFQMAFEPGFSTMMTNASHLNYTNERGVDAFLLLTSGQATRTGSVPLPSTFFLFAAGFGLILCFRQWCSNSMRRLSNQET